MILMKMLKHCQKYLVKLKSKFYTAEKKQYKDNVQIKFLRRGKGEQVIKVTMETTCDDVP